MPVYSHSRLGVYETSPRQYRFQHVDKVPVPEVRTVEMFVGSQVTIAAITPSTASAPWPSSAA